MLLSFIAIIVGFALLVWGADRFVVGSVGLARVLGVSPLLIGLTIVGIGTSAPEIIVSIMASIQGNSELALGNAIGSNIANIALILGVTALITPLVVNSDILKKEYPILLSVSLGAYLLLQDGDLNRLDGAILLSGVFITLALLVWISRQRRNSDPLVSEYEAELPGELSLKSATGWFILGLAVLLLGSRLLVWGAVNIAVAFGVSDLVIGLTIIAIGTSLPELAASITSALKKEHELAIGNVIGSNIYNLLAVLCVPGLISPGLISNEVVIRDLPVMLGLTVALYVMGYGFRGPGRINRVEALLLVLAFIGYQAWIFLEATAGTLATGT